MSRLPQCFSLSVYRCVSVVGATESQSSSNENAGTTSLLDSLLSSLGEELGLDDDGDLGEGALAENLEEALERISESDVQPW